jgi:hypothetical protein
MFRQPETRNQKPETKLTRRALAAVLSTSAALLAQPPSVPLPSNPDEELKAAKDTIQQNSAQLAKFDLPMSTEPAVHFRA